MVLNHEATTQLNRPFGVVFFLHMLPGWFFLGVGSVSPGSNRSGLVHVSGKMVR